MENIGRYLISVTAAGVICGILMSFPEKNSAFHRILGILCGVFMSVTLLSPVMRLELGDAENFIQRIRQESDFAVEAGKSYREAAMAAIIKPRLEAYIQDKASSMGLSLDVQVTLTDEEIPQPGSVLLIGAAAPYPRAQLGQWIRQTMGIGEEAQFWKEAG